MRRVLFAIAKFLFVTKQPAATCFLDYYKHD